MKTKQEMVFPAHCSEPMRRALEAAAKGDPDSQIALGRMYEHGDGFPQNFSEAVRWYLKAATASPRAKYLMALMYANGRGVSRDLDTAIKWLTESAKAGNPEAQHMLGSLYARGKGVPMDMKKAAEYFRMSAENGDDGAQLIYGLMLRDGRGVPRDDVAAYIWIGCAIANRPMGRKRKTAVQALESVALRMNPEQIKEAQERLVAKQPTANTRRPLPPAGKNHIAA